MSCLLATRGMELIDRQIYEDLLSGMQYVVCPITEAESLHLNYTRGIGPERVAEQREFLDEAEFLPIGSSTAKIYSDLDWPRGADTSGLARTTSGLLRWRKNTESR